MSFHENTWFVNPKLTKKALSDMLHQLHTYQYINADVLTLCQLHPPGGPCFYALQHTVLPGVLPPPNTLGILTKKNPCALPTLYTLSYIHAETYAMTSMMRPLVIGDTIGYNIM